jgi:hypothetical protein
MSKKNEYNTFTSGQIADLKLRVKRHIEFALGSERQPKREEIYVGVAAIVARFAHKNQFLKMGNHAYITHPAYVASQLKDPYERQIALLHDAIEKSNLTADDLLEMGFEPDVVADIQLLTRDKNMPYLQYIEKVGHSLRAGAVKIEDILHNTRADRIVVYDEPPAEWAMLKRESYPIALAYLQAIQEGEIKPGTPMMDFICDSDFLKSQSGVDLHVMRKILYVHSADPGRMKRFDERVAEGVAIGELARPVPPPTIDEAPVHSNTGTMGGGPG